MKEFFEQGILMKRTLAPLHSGEILREEYLERRGLTNTEVANGLGNGSCESVAVVNERSGIRPELAVKLTEAFGTSAQFWMIC